MAREEHLISESMAAMGLRERKRVQAMHRIQSVALDLFDEHGFDDVTIERIAADSDVSPSTVYRYFGTKEQLVIWDEYDPLALKALTAELGNQPPLEAIRSVVAAVMGSAVADDEDRIRRRLRLAFTNPSVEAASTLQGYEMAGLIAGLVAAHLDRDVDDLDVQVFSHAFVGGLLGALRHWYASGFTTPFSEIIDRPLAALERTYRLN